MGGYRSQMSDQRNATNHTQRDYGHIREIGLLTGPVGIDPEAQEAPARPRAAMHPGIRCRTWNALGEEIEAPLG